MAITAVNEIFRGREAEATALQGRKYTRMFHVQVDGPSDTLAATLFAADPTDKSKRIPQPGEAHDVDQFAFCQRVKPKQVDDTDKLHHVTAEYSTLIGEQETVADPLARPPQFTWGFQSGTEEYQFDVDGDPSLNSAGVPYDPPLVRTRSVPVLTVMYNTAKFAESMATEYIDTVNRDLFRVVGYDIPPDQAKLVGWTATAKTEGGIFYFDNHVVLQFKRRDPGWPKAAPARPWDQVISQYGFQQLVQCQGASEPQRLVQIMIPQESGNCEPDNPDAPKIQPQEPLPLSTDGAWVGDENYLGTETSAAWKIHIPYRRLPFGPLNLGVPG